MFLLDQSIKKNRLIWILKNIIPTSDIKYPKKTFYLNFKEHNPYFWHQGSSLQPNASVLWGVLDHSLRSNPPVKWALSGNTSPRYRNSPLAVSISKLAKLCSSQCLPVHTTWVQAQQPFNTWPCSTFDSTWYISGMPWPLSDDKRKHIWGEINNCLLKDKHFNTSNSASPHPTTGATTWNFPFSKIWNLCDCASDCGTISTLWFTTFPT